MTQERIFAEIIRENTFDPHRSATSRLNKLLKNQEPYFAVKDTSDKYPQSAKILQDALEYASQFEESPQKQALLAYMFTAGRKIVDDYVREKVVKNDVVLDRWSLTGCAYQVDRNGYTWQDIMQLNEAFGIIIPDVQIILTCPIDQIPLRKAYREKQAVGTAGQMSGEKEHIILSAFEEIYNHLKMTSKVFMFENGGVPTQKIKDQIRQAIPTFDNIETILRKSGFTLRSGEISNVESFWFDPERISRIHEKQTR